MPVLSRAERDAFLAEPGVLMRVAVVRDDGSPLVTPIWFLHDAEEDAIYFTPREKSEWFACLRRDPRAALCIDEQPLPYRKVIAEGSAELVHDVGADDAWRDLYRRIASRYVPPEAAEAYVQNTIEQPRGLFRLALGSATVKSWRMPLEGEDQTGIWHERYFVPGTWGSPEGSERP
ncbi:MAG: pyridoxamine 5'-phosphate oxidase family protein [Pseudomonadota bacterium]